MLQSLATALHTVNGPITGQTAPLNSIDSNPTIHINTDQPLVHVSVYSPPTHTTRQRWLKVTVHLAALCAWWQRGYAGMRLFNNVIQESQSVYGDHTEHFSTSTVSTVDTDQPLVLVSTVDRRQSLETAIRLILFQVCIFVGIPISSCPRHSNLWRF